jgi:hypothetical protein
LVYNWACVGAPWRRATALLLLVALLNSVLGAQADAPPPTGSAHTRLQVDDIDCLAEWLVEQVLARHDHSPEDECDLDVDTEFRLAKHRMAKYWLAPSPSYPALLAANLPTSPAQLGTKAQTSRPGLAYYEYLCLLYPA